MALLTIGLRQALLGDRPLWPLAEQRQAIEAARDELLQQIVEQQQGRAELEAHLAAAQDQVELLSAEARFADNLRREQGQLKNSLHESAPARGASRPQ